MVRLIDADALVYDDIADEPDENLYVVFQSDIDKMPTVDAVPVDFIKKYQNTCNDDGKMTITDMLATWDILRKTWKSKGKV